MARSDRQFSFEEQTNPFEMALNPQSIMSSLDEIDNRDLRYKFKNTQDPINLAFQSVQNTSLQKLAKDFVKESFDDIVSFISKFVNN